MGIFRAISVFIMISIVNPWLLIGAFVALILMVLITKKAIRPLVETQRLDSIYRGPIHSTFAMIVDGLVTLRAYEKIDFFKIDFEH